MISIMMPIYNGLEFFEKAYESIKAQTFQDWELIIGINGYPPDSMAYRNMRNYNSDKVKVLDLPQVVGKSQALNEMLQYCQYDWLAILDVDDYWEPTKLEKQIPYLGTYDIVGTLGQYFGTKGDLINIKSGEVSFFELLVANQIINSSSIFRKEDAHWEPKFDGVEDYFMWLRLAMDGKTIYNVPEVLTHHQIYAGSFYNTKLFKLLADWKIPHRNLSMFLISHLKK